MVRTVSQVIIVFLLFSQQVYADKPKPPAHDKSGIKAAIQDVKNEIEALYKAKHAAVEDSKKKYNTLMAKKGGFDEKRAAEVAVLQQQMSDALDKVDSAYRTEAANLKAKGTKLRLDRDKMAARRDAEVAKANSSTDQNSIKDKYQPQLEAMDSRIDANNRALADHKAKHDSEVSNIKANFLPKIGALSGKNRIDHDKISALWNERNAEVHKIEAHYDNQINGLKAKLGDLEHQLKKK